MNTETLNLLLGLAAVLTPLMTAITLFLTARTNSNLRLLERNTNSKMDVLLEEAKVVAKAKGVLQEKERQDLENSSKNKF